MRRPARRASQARSREAGGHRPGPLRGSAAHAGWTGTGNGGKSAATKSPEERSLSPKSPRWSVERRFRSLWSPAIRRSCGGHCYQGAPFGAPPPLTFRGVISSKTRAHRAARMRRFGCLKFKFDRPRGTPHLAPLAGRGEEPYCTLSATKRNSPSAFATSSSTDFLPSFLSWSTRFLTSAALVTASWATSTMTSPALSRFSAASEP